MKLCPDCHEPVYTMLQAIEHTERHGGGDQVGSVNKASVNGKRKADRHRPGYMADYMRQRRAGRKLNQ